MQADEKLYNKFPSVLREKLLNKEISFPEGTLFSYERLFVYRAVERTQNDNRKISIADFRSYFELKKTPKAARGLPNDFTKDPHYYGVSSFLDKKIVEQMMKFPNPNKKMAAGYVYSEGGPQHTTEKNQHVCWWLFEGADVSNFRLLEEKDKNE